MSDRPLLSVVCVTYNHESYIAQAIESFLMQKTSFPFEIVIGEDCSTDKTREICSEYQKKYPDKINLIVSESNIGAGGNFLRTLKAAQGQYVAYCEGDDYWTDPNKLQKQVDFLENNPDFTITSHNVTVLKEDENGNVSKSTEWLGKKNPEIMTLEHILRYGSGGASCSLLFKNRIFENFPQWYVEATAGDWALQVLYTERGKMKYFREVMGVYRRHPKGSLFSAVNKAKDGGRDAFALPAKYSLIQNEIVNKYFNYKYDRLIKKQNAYWYKYYLKEYLRRFNLVMAIKYAVLFLKAWL